VLWISAVKHKTGPKSFSESNIQEYIIYRKKLAWEKSEKVHSENRVMHQYAIWLSEASYCCQKTYGGSKMTTCTITYKDKSFYIHSKLGFYLSDDPYVGLVTIIYAVRIWIVRR